MGYDSGGESGCDGGVDMVYDSGGGVGVMVEWTWGPLVIQKKCL